MSFSRFFFGHALAKKRLICFFEKEFNAQPFISITTEIFVITCTLDQLYNFLVLYCMYLLSKNDLYWN